MWDEIIYPFPNFNCNITVELWEWINYFFPHFIMDVMLKLNLIHVSKGAPCVCCLTWVLMRISTLMLLLWWESCKSFVWEKICECECTHMHCELCYWIMRIYSYSVAIEHITCSFWKGMYVYNTFYKFRFLSCFVLLWYVVNNNSWCDLIKTKPCTHLMGCKVF